MQDALNSRDEMSPASAQPLPDDALAENRQTSLEAVEVIALGVTMMLALAGLGPVLFVLLFI